MGLIDISRSIRSTPFSQSTDNQIDPGLYVNVAAANEAVFLSSADGPLSAGNLDNVEQVSGSVTSSVPGFSPNIQEKSGGSSMASGFWKIVMYINSATDLGKTEQHVWNGGPSSTIDAAKTTALALVRARSRLLGGKAVGFSLGAPQIQWVTVADAVNPRNGSLIKLASGSGLGPSSVADAPADFLTTAISWQMVGTSSTTPPLTSKSTATVVGQPDACVVAEQFVPGAALGDGNTITAALDTWINYLRSPANALGFMGLSSGEAKKVASKNGLSTDNLWQWTLGAHGYTTGDRCRLTGSRVPGWAGTYKVIVSDADHFRIDSRIPTTATQPNTVTFQRIQLANKQRVQDFYRYTGFTDTPYKIAKRNPRKAFHGLSFKHKTRRAA